MPTLFNQRRDFLKYAACAAVTGFVQQPRWCWASDDPPLFSFVQLNDTHVQAPLEKKDPALDTYDRANEKLRWMVDEIGRGPQPDFILGVGDMIHGERLDRLKLDLECFHEIIKPLTCPFYPNLGNHENVQAEGNPSYERAYQEGFGEDRINYAFEFRGIRFVMLNNSGAPMTPSSVRESRNRWLKETLAKDNSLPTLIGCHIPLVPIRDEHAIKSSFGFASWSAQDPELLETIDQAKSVVAVLSGHLHLTGCVERKGVRHISIAGTASYPSDFARYKVYVDRIEMEVVQLPPDLAKSYPSIHGVPRHGAGFTDSQHKTSEEYEIGRSDERRLTIPLTKTNA